MKLDFRMSGIEEWLCGISEIKGNAFELSLAFVYWEWFSVFLVVTK